MRTLIGAQYTIAAIEYCVKWHITLKSIDFLKNTDL